MSDSGSTKRPAAEGDSQSSLESTVDLFSNRIARKLKEKDAKEVESEREAEVRQALMLESMTTIRKALQETLRINLGNRFSLDIEIDDLNGWPRVQLLLTDSLAPEQIDYGIVVSANDRKELGTIEIKLLTGETLGKVHLCDQGEFEKLALILKRAVREFLDIIAAYILNPKRPEELLATQSRALEDPEADVISNKLAGEDVFTEEINPQANIVTADAQDAGQNDEELKELDSLDFDISKNLAT